MGHHVMMIDYALLLLGAFAAAAISGAAGFGGALLLLPLLSRTAGVEAAVPLLTVAQLVRNLSRVAFNYREIRWRPVALFSLCAVPAAVCGALSFVTLPKNLVVRVIGGAILFFVVLRAFGFLKIKPSKKLLVVGGGAVGFLSGLVGSAGPLGAAIFLTLNLPPLAYIGSEAVTAVVMHAAKMAVYESELSLGADFWPLAIALGCAMVLGTWASKRVIERIPPKRFRLFVGLLLTAIAVQMIVTG